MEIINPHDKFFKETFGRVPVAKDFISNYLSPSITNLIDLDTLKPQKDSFINEKLQEGFSDLLFKADISGREGYIYFLFEHKSYPSRNIAIQLLRYMTEIWDAKSRKDGDDSLPVIIPLVVYQGKRDWNIKTTLGEMIPGYNDLPSDLKVHIPDYKYLLYDFTGYTDEEIKGQVTTKIAMTIMRDIQTKNVKGIIESLFKAAMYLQELEDKQTGMEYFEILMRYLFSVRSDITKDDFNELVNKIESIYPEGSEVVMTLVEVFKEEGKIEGRIEGKLEGRIEGRKEGRKEEKIGTITKLLTKRFGSLPIEIKERIRELDLITLDLILDSVLDYESLEEVKKHLQ